MEHKALASPTQFSDLNKLLDDFVPAVKNILKDNFVGAYLQGSFALGDADLQSDCDFLVVTHTAISPEGVNDLRQLHYQARKLPNHWAGHLEGSYVPQDELYSLSNLGKKWLFVDQGHSGSDIELSAHCNTEVVRWILREHGVTLDGPDPNRLVDEVPPGALRHQMRKEISSFLPDMLTWIQLDSPWAQRCAVATICRIIYTLEKGEVASKRASLLWAAESLSGKWKPLIKGALEGRALGWNHSDPIEPGSVEAIEAFYEYAKQKAGEFSRS
jgi:hypothetical protein